MPPPSRGSSVTEPPCSSAICATIDSPRPEPGSVRALVGAVEAVEHLRRGPRRRCRGRGRRTSTRRAVHDHVDRRAGRAELQRVVDQVGDGAVEHRPAAVDDAGVGRASTSISRAGAAPEAASRPSSASSASSTGSTGSSLRTSVASSTSSLDQVGELVELEPGLGDELRALLGVERRWPRPRKLDVGAHAVSGVRSSWLASTTSRCCCSRDVSSASSIVLKLGGEATDLVVARRPGSAWSRSWVSAMCSAVVA